MSAGLREIKRGEAALFAEWEAAERPYPWTAAHFEADVASARRVFVWDDGGRPAAFAVLQVAADEAHLHNLMVHPAYRRKGIGSMLLQKVMIEARDSGAAVFVLDVDAANRPAISMYLKAGFQTLQKRRASYPRGEDALVMKKDL